MATYVLSHPWEVQQMGDGTLIRLTPRDLNVETVSVLADELFELALENGQTTLYLDFDRVACLASIVAGKLFVLARRLRELGGRLVLHNLRPAVQECLEAEGWPNDVEPVVAARRTDTPRS